MSLPREPLARGADFTSHWRALKQA